MESKNQKGTSSSFTSELFGSKESRSSAGIFGSLFSAPTPKVLCRESLRNELNNGKIVNQSWRNKFGTQDGNSKNISGSETQKNTQNKDLSLLYQDQRVQPCHLSSSLYYGGQDIYYHPQSTQDARFNSLNEAVEDDSGSASRGNWWQGSLYY